MALMVIDHVRYAFTDVAVQLYGSSALLMREVTNLAVTTPFLFSMRWVTHICAPSFVFLAGVGVFFWNIKYGQDRSYTKHFLFRGFFLVAIDLIINAKALMSQEGIAYLGVLWAIGVSMIFFPLVAKLPIQILFFLAIFLTFLSNSLGYFSLHLPEEAERILFTTGTLDFLSTPEFTFFIGYPVLPWFAVMLFGFAFAKVFSLQSTLLRQKILICTGIAFLAAFVALRVFHFYGDSMAFVFYDTWWKTVASFVSVSKYPPSLQFFLITLGVMFCLLAAVERFDIRPRALLVFGSVPLFFYCAHLLYIEIITFVLKQAVMFYPLVGEISFSPSGVILCTLVLLFMLYPSCLLFTNIKNVILLLKKPTV